MAVGTVRIIPPPLSLSDKAFPMQRVCPPELLHHLPLQTTGEISRFAVSKLRGISCSSIAMARLSLMQGILRISNELGLTHWCAIMEPSLLRLLQRNAIYFSSLGPVIEYHGIRQPTCGRVHTVLDRMQREQCDVWNYITLGGQLCYATAEERLVA
jgi:N-acyl-L-homoserine lactone synthetase